MREWIDIALLTRARNLRGGLVAQPAAGLPFLLSEGLHVALVPPVLDAPRSVCVEKVEQSAETSWVVFFAEVKTREVAEQLVGCHCLARRLDVEMDGSSLVLPGAHLVGWQVVDALTGLVGEVVSVEAYPSQSMLVVRLEDDSEVLIPLVVDFVIEADENERVLRLDLPQGMLDL